MNFRDPQTLKQELYMRMPKPRRSFQGMYRPTFERLGKTGQIEVITVQQRGCSRGIKLIYLPSLYRFLDGLRAEQAAKIAADPKSGTTVKKSLSMPA
jgi:hypothetical protein